MTLQQSYSVNKIVNLNAYSDNSMARQAIIDGNFQIAQANPVVASEVTAPATWAYPVFDLWQVGFNVDGGTAPTIKHSQQALTMGAIPNSKFYYNINVNGAGTDYGVDSYYGIQQSIEHGVQNLCGLGKKLTVSFYAKSTIANKKLGFLLYQNYGTGGNPTAYEEIAGSNVTLTSTWTKYTYTFTTNTLVGKTFGTANDDKLQLRFQLQWGTNGKTSVGASAAETFVGSGDISIAQVQLNAGEIAMPFQPKSFGDELRACQRYFEKSFSYLIAPAVNLGLTSVGLIYWNIPAGSTYRYMPVNYAVAKRITGHTVTIYPSGNGTTGQIYGEDIGGGNAGNWNASAGNVGNNGFTAIMNNTLPNTNKPTGFHFTADARF